MTTWDLDWPGMLILKKMKNSLVISFLLFTSIDTKSQILEAVSVPYRFEIDHVHEYEDVSPSYGYAIAPYKFEIRNRIEDYLKSWFESEGFLKSNEPEYNELLKSKIEEFRPLAIQEVGEEALNHSEKWCLFLAENLEFQVYITGFKPFLIDIPLIDVESFRLNIEALDFQDSRISFNRDGEFVIRYLEIYNPINGKKYYFHNNREATVQVPSFNINLPATDL